VRRLSFLFALLLLLPFPRAEALPPVHWKSGNGVGSQELAIGDGATALVYTEQLREDSSQRICVILQRREGDGYRILAQGCGSPTQYVFDAAPPWHARVKGVIPTDHDRVGLDLEWTGTGLTKSVLVFDSPGRSTHVFVMLSKTARIRGTLRIGDRLVVIHGGVGSMAVKTPTT
jgi:hypothetical protein